MFYGELSFGETTSKVYQNIDLSMPQYFGLSSPEIDYARADLMRGSSILEYFGSYWATS